MVSESQERMLAVVEPSHLDDFLAVCTRWETGAAVVGTVTESGLIRVLDGELVLGELAVSVLVDGCPLYELSPERPATQIYPRPARSLETEDATEILLALLASANICDRKYLFEQYDCVVQSRTVRRPGQADAAVLQLEGDGAIAVSIDGNGRRVAADPYWGTIEAVLECVSNLACVGAEPLGLTNCLNFGNPEKPHIAWQLTESIRALGDACRALQIPVVGGNVSLYNEGPDGPIYPTPVVGIVGGGLAEPALAGRLGFANTGDAIALVGGFAPELAACELAKLRGEELPTELAAIDIAAVTATQRTIRDAVRAGTLHSAHDIAEGGLATALAECCIAAGLGAVIELEAGSDAALFGETAGCFVVSGDPSALRQLDPRTPHQIIGSVGGASLQISAGETRIELSLERLREAHGAGAALFD
jgi:phosphoribosylformylglycinamidine synthase